MVPNKNKKTLESEIIALRKKGLSYRQIETALNCSKGSVSYHCKKNAIVDTGMKNYEISDDLKQKISKYCKENTNKSASEHFNLSLSTIKKYKNHDGRAE